MSADVLEAALAEMETVAEELAAMCDEDSILTCQEDECTAREACRDASVRLGALALKFRLGVPVAP